MILDKNLLVSNNQAITSSAASTDVIDIGVARDIGIGDPLELIAVITASLDAVGSATLVTALEGSVDNSNWTVMAQTRAIGKADLLAGRELCRFKLPATGAGQAHPRYYRLNYTVATGPMTAGTVTAGLNLDRQANHAYPPGIVVNN